MKKIFLIGLISAVVSIAQAQQKQDTVIIELAKKSKIIFTLGDRSDLEILKHYNFQELFNDVLTKLGKKDTTVFAKDYSIPTDSTDAEEQHENQWSRHEDDEDRNNDEDEDEDDDDWNKNWGSRKWGRTWQSFNFDLGTNNYLSDGKFPDNDNAPYAVRPWGSWYLAANSIQRTRLSKKLFLEWGLGLSWYTFKFQNDNIRIEKNDDGIEFVEDMRDANFIKSKFGMSFIQASLVPVIDFGENRRKPRIWDGYGNSFRIGLGPYVGYKISSRSKLVYNDGGREKEKNRDSFYLSNVRYGARLQIGYRSTDLFFNYDFNELFTEGKGPKLNAFSFGVIF